jgi:hypothetical protein
MVSDIIISDIWRHFREASLAVDWQAIETPPPSPTTHFFSKKSAAVCNFWQVLSLCYEQNSSNCLSECGLSVYNNFNVLSNAVDFIALMLLMIRAGLQDGGLWIQCTVYVVKNILNFTKVILVLIKSKNSFSYIKGHAVHLKDISNRSDF